MIEQNFQDYDAKLDKELTEIQEYCALHLVPKDFVERVFLHYAAVGWNIGLSNGNVKHITKYERGKKIVSVWNDAEKRKHFLNPLAFLDRRRY